MKGLGNKWEFSTASIKSWKNITRSFVQLFQFISKITALEFYSHYHVIF